MWKKSNEIKGVSAASFVDLQATLLSAKETAKSSGSSLTAQPVRSAIHFKTPSSSTSSSSAKDLDNKHNSGVDQRNQRDAEAMEREKKNLQSGQKRLEEKSALYEKLMSSASRSSSLDGDFLDDDRRAPLVDFERKSWESDSQVISSMKRKRQIESLAFLSSLKDDSQDDRDDDADQDDDDDDDDDDGGGVGVSRRGSSEPLAKRHRARASTNPFTFLPQEESESDRDQRVELAKKASLATEMERRKLQDLQRQKNLSKLRRLQQIREQSTSSSTLSKSILQTLSAAASSPPSSPETTQDDNHTKKPLDFLDSKRSTPSSSSSSSQTRSQRNDYDYDDDDEDEVGGATYNAEIKRGIAPPANLYQTITPQQPKKETPKPPQTPPKAPQAEIEATTLNDQNADLHHQYQLQQQQYAQYYQQQQQYQQYYYGQQQVYSDPQQTGTAPQSYDQYYQQYYAQQPADPYYQGQQPQQQHDYSQYYQQQQYYPPQDDQSRKTDPS